MIVEANTEINEDLAAQVQLSGLQKVRLRSALTCESRRGICVKCYGRNLATGNTVEIGEAVGSGGRAEAVDRSGLRREREVVPGLQRRRVETEKDVGGRTSECCA